VGNVSKRSSARAKTPAQMPAPNPCGRVDIALCRLLDLGVQMYATPQMKELYTSLAPTIQNGIRAVVGPRTEVGVNAKRVVGVVQLIAGEIAGSGNGRKTA
jgi:hypothetical protein